MKAIAILAVIICCLLMFRVRRPYKAAIIILGTIVFTTVRVPYVPIDAANSMIAICFLISEFPNLKRLINNTKGTIVWRLMGLSLFTSLVVILTSPHLRDANSIRIFAQVSLFFSYFGLLYAFWCSREENNFKPILKITFWGLIVLTVFGVINYITKSADFVSLMMSDLKNAGMGGAGDEVGQHFTYEDRFRVQAMFANPFDYGYICVLIMLLHIYGYTRKMENKITFLITMICSGFGIFTCGCRTILFCFLIGISVYSLLAFKASKSLRIVLFLAFLIPVSYQTIPPVQEQIDKMMTMFEKNSDVGGSSVELRTLQYTTVLWYIQDSPWFGRGYGFFSQDLGWSKGSDYAMDSRLAGMEGVAMNKLLERGFIGLLLYAVFWISLIIFMFKNRSVSSPLTALGLSILAVYLSFANMTGELLSVYPTLLLLGFTIKAIEVKKVVPPPYVIYLNRKFETLVLSHIPCKTLNFARL
jgi:O-antigen ligase